METLLYAVSIVLSTMHMYNIFHTCSNLPVLSFSVFGFGPVVQDGFGIGYIIRDNGLQYSISSKHRQTERFAHTLKQTLIDMGKLIQPMNSLKVECSRTGTQNVEKDNATAEYLEAYSDTYGEGPQLSNSFEKLQVTTPPRPMASSRGFARVLHKQNSMSLMRLSSFGENITPREGRKKLGEDDEQYEG